MNKEEIKYPRITCSICFDPGEFVWDENGVKFGPEFHERYEKFRKFFEGEFEEMLIEKFGEEGWAVRFIEYPANSYFFVDIYLDENIDFNDLLSSVGSKLSANRISYHPFHRGTLQDYFDLFCKLPLFSDHS